MATGTAEAVSAPRLPRGFSAPAGIYLVLVAAAATVLVVPFHPRPVDHTDWLLFGVLTVCAMAAQLFTVQEPEHQSRTTTSVFLVAAALLLPLPLVALTCFLAHVPEWV